VYGVDYYTVPAAVNGQISVPIPKDSLSVCFDIIPLDDFGYEADEQLLIRLKEAGGVVGGEKDSLFVLFIDDVNPLLDVRLQLEGPYDPGTELMNDDLRHLPNFPLTEPFTESGHSNVISNVSEVLDASLLNITGPTAIVDWVLIELRTAADPSVLLSARPGLVLRNGHVVGTDGELLRTGNAPGFYHVAVRHRNHLGAMTNGPLVVAAVTDIDLTDPNTICYGVDARKQVNGKMLLWAGDVNSDGQLKYVGADNDRDPILVNVGGSIPTNSLNGYFNTDVNLDGIVKYVGADNDRDPILVNIGGSVPTQVRVEQVP